MDDLTNENAKSDALVNSTGGQRICIATKKDGTPCQAPARVGPYCIGHSPGAQEARRKGGRNSSKKARLDAMLPLRLRPVLELLEESLTAVSENRLKPSQGQAIASLASSVVKVLEAGIFEERLNDLEARFGTGRLLSVRREEEITSIE